MRTALRKLGAVLRALGAAVGLGGSGSPEPSGSSPPFSARLSNGRLYRSTRVRDVHVGALSLRYAFFTALIVALASVAFSPPAVAGSGVTAQSAMASCQSALKAGKAGGAYWPADETCTNFQKSASACYVWLWSPSTGSGSVINQYDWDCSTYNPSASTACTTLPTTTNSLTGTWLVGMTVPQYAQDPSTGLSVTCTLVATAVGAPTQNPYDGRWYSRVTLSPNPNPAGGSTAQAGTVSNADGSTPNPAIPNVQTPVPPTSPSPKICGGGSCYDPNTDTYTAVDSAGNQTSVPGSTARSAAGGCVSSASATVCSGSPTAPTPPSPPASPITDPSNDLRSIDTVNQVNPSTGQVQNVTTVVYGTPGNKTTSGQKTGDSGPASSSSTGGNGTCTAGKICNDVYVGAACGYDPSATGDPLLSAIAVDMHHVRCAADANNLSASDFDSADHTLGDQTQTPDSVFSQSSTTTDPTTVLDSSGFLGGGRSCPGFPEVEFMGNPIITDSKVCDIFGMWAQYILAMGYVLGAIILYRGRAS